MNKELVPNSARAHTHEARARAHTQTHNEQHARAPPYMREARDTLRRTEALFEKLLMRAVWFCYGSRGRRRRTCLQ